MGLADALAGSYHETALGDSQWKVLAYRKCIGDRADISASEMRPCARRADPQVKLMQP